MGALYSGSAFRRIVVATCVAMGTIAIAADTALAKGEGEDVCACLDTLEVLVDEVLDLNRRVVDPASALAAYDDLKETTLDIVDKVTSAKDPVITQFEANSYALLDDVADLGDAATADDRAGVTQASDAIDADAGDMLAVIGSAQSEQKCKEK